MASELPLGQMVHLNELLPSSGMLSTIDPQDLSGNECGSRQDIKTQFLRLIAARLPCRRLP
jgi:hypothetical protein